MLRLGTLPKHLREITQWVIQERERERERDRLKDLWTIVGRRVLFWELFWQNKRHSEISKAQNFWFRKPRSGFLGNERFRLVISTGNEMSTIIDEHRASEAERNSFSDQILFSERCSVNSVYRLKNRLVKAKDRHHLRVSSWKFQQQLAPKFEANRPFIAWTSIGHPSSRIHQDDRIDYFAFWLKVLIRALHSDRIKASSSGTPSDVGESQNALGIWRLWTATPKRSPDASWTVFSYCRTKGAEE